MDLAANEKAVHADFFNGKLVDSVTIVHCSHSHEGAYEIVL